jgi:cobalt-zinc-cadmium efflux system outer membrane protein
MQLLRMFLLGLVVVGSGGNRAEAAGNGDQPAELGVILAQPVITLPDLFRIAELASPGLASARAGVRAHAGRVRQAGLYPNPELTLAVEEMSVTDSQRRKQKVELSQALLLGGRRGGAVAQARAEHAAAAYEAEQVRRNTLREVHRLWIELMSLREKQTALTELLVLAGASQEMARTRFAAQAAPEAHLTRAVLEVYELEMMGQQFVEDEVRAAAELQALLGGVAVPAERLTGDLEPGVEWIPAEFDGAGRLARHPLALAVSQELAAAEAGARAARAARLPDLNLFVAYGRFEADEGNFVEGGVSFPLPLFDRNQGRIAETRALVAQAGHVARGLVSELDVALASARARHDMAHTQLDRINADITPAAARGLAGAQAAYRVGRIMFLELIDAQRTYADVLLRGFELRRNLALAEADITSLLGEGLYRNRGVSE